MFMPHRTGGGGGGGGIVPPAPFLDSTALHNFFVEKLQGHGVL